MQELYERLRETESDERIVKEAMEGLEKAVRLLRVQSIEIINGNEGNVVSKQWYEAFKHVAQAYNILKKRLDEIRAERDRIMHYEIEVDDEVD